MMHILYITLLACSLLACSQAKNQQQEKTTVSQAVPVTSTPSFNADSAYTYVENQVKFGPRVPNSQAHKACGNYLASELKRFGAKVYEQEATLTAYDNTGLEAKNIIGSFNPDNNKRILLFAHWDSRPYSDHDPDPANYRKPIDGADDGGSGVGALLEIARQIGQKDPGIGVDIIFFDAEDYGTPEFAPLSRAGGNGTGGHAGGPEGTGRLRYPARHGRRQKRYLF